MVALPFRPAGCAGKVDLQDEDKTEESAGVPALAPRQRQRRRKPGEEPIQFVSDSQVLDLLHHIRFVPAS